MTRGSSYVRLKLTASQSGRHPPTAPGTVNFPLQARLVRGRQPIDITSTAPTLSTNPHVRARQMWWRTRGRPGRHRTVGQLDVQLNSWTVGQLLACIRRDLTFSTRSFIYRKCLHPLHPVYPQIRMRGRSIGGDAG